MNKLLALLLTGLAVIAIATTTVLGAIYWLERDQESTAVESLAAISESNISVIQDLKLSVRSLLTNPFFGSELFCRSLQDLSDFDAYKTFAHKASQVVDKFRGSADPLVQEATGEIVKDECRRIY